MERRTEGRTDGRTDMDKLYPSAFGYSVKKRVYCVFFRVYFIHIHKQRRANEHVLNPVVFDLAGPQSLGTKQYQMYNLGVCSVLYAQVQIKLALRPTFNHTTITDRHSDTTYSSGVAFLVYQIFKQITDGFRAHDSCIETQTIVQPLRCVYANRRTDGHMRAVLASVIKQYLPKRFSHFFFRSELVMIGYSSHGASHVFVFVSVVLLYLEYSSM